MDYPICGDAPWFQVHGPLVHSNLQKVNSRWIVQCDKSKRTGREGEWCLPITIPGIRAFILCSANVVLLSQYWVKGLQSDPVGVHYSIELNT